MFRAFIRALSSQKPFLDRVREAGGYGTEGIGEIISVIETEGDMYGREI